MAIKGVTDVKPYRNTEQEIEITIIPKKGGFDHELRNKILIVEAEIQESLKPRRQKFFASISW